MATEPEDELDRLFARLIPLSPPAPLIPRLLGVAVQEQRQRSLRRWIWAVVDGAALMLLAFLGYRLGQELRLAGTLDLLTLAGEDLGLLTGGISEFWEALLASVPWFSLAGVLLSLAAIAVATGFLIQSWEGGYPHPRSPLAENHES